MKRIIKMIACATLIAASATAAAQSTDSRPIRMIIPQPAGGSMDSNARALSDPLARELGRNIVIDNRSGANGIIAGELLAKAPPDGNTLLFTSGSLTYNQIINKKTPFDVLVDFIPITQFARSFGYIVLVNPQVGVSSIKELVELSKKRQIAYGSGGIGNSQQFLGEFINLRTGAKLTHVPYKGLAVILNALMGNEVQVAFASPLTVTEHIRTGRLRPLAYTGESRWPRMPELPTMAEAGVPNCVFEPAGHGIFAPAKTPAAIVNKIQGAVAQSLKNPGLLQYLTKGGYVPVGSTPAEFRRFIEDDLKRIREIAQFAKIEAN